MIYRTDRFLFFCGVATIIATLSSPLPAQTTRDACIQITVTAQNNGSTRLDWLAPDSAQPAELAVRSWGEPDWLTIDTITSAPWSATVNYAHPVEIRILQWWTASNIPFVNSGYVALHRRDSLDAKATEAVLVVVDSEVFTALQTDVETLFQDLLLEGWVVLKQIVSPSVSVTQVRQHIKDAYANSNGARLTHVLLFGNIPYATSGGFSASGGYPNPDYHPEHGGAWASDAFYADMITSRSVGAEYQWTDEFVDITDTNIAKRIENRNVPFDGKLDNCLIPTDLELCIGRVDMSNLPTFGTTTGSRDTEFALLRKYLQKNHRYRTHAAQPELRALVDDVFGVFSYDEQGLRYTEAFAASGWRSFAPIVGAANMIEGDWIPDAQKPRPSLDTVSALLAYGCGPGGYEHCDYVANVQELATHPNYSVFTLLFGSYFGDVNSTDNMLRAVLAQDGTTLTSAWSGRPHWQLHHLACGQTIGQCARASANNYDDYLGATVIDPQTQEYAPYPLGNRGVHVMLLGDPTLRMQGPYMQGAITVERSSPDSVHLSWLDAHTHPAMQNHTIVYAIEGAATPTEPFALLGTTTATTATVLTLPTTRIIRVRPLFSAATLCGMFNGRGALAEIPPEISSVAEDQSFTNAHIALYSNYLGQVLYCAESALPRGLWFRLLPNGKGLIAVFGK